MDRVLLDDKWYTEVGLVWMLTGVWWGPRVDHAAFVGVGSWGGSRSRGGSSPPAATIPTGSRACARAGMTTTRRIPWSCRAGKGGVLGAAGRGSGCLCQSAAKARGRRPAADIWAGCSAPLPLCLCSGCSQPSAGRATTWSTASPGRVSRARRDATPRRRDGHSAVAVRVRRLQARRGVHASTRSSSTSRVRRGRVGAGCCGWF